MTEKTKQIVDKALEKERGVALKFKRKRGRPGYGPRKN